MKKQFDFAAYQTVQVNQEGHARHGQAGRVVDTNDQTKGDGPETYLVQFDVDQAIEAIEGQALRVLS